MNMKIQVVRIDGFKNLSKVSIDFDRITALVALNNFGKSNMLSAIDFGFAFIKAPADRKIDLMSNRTLIPINQRMYGRNFSFEIEGTTECAGQEYRVQYGYEFSWRTEEDKIPTIVREFLRAKPNDKGQKYTQFINRTQEASFYKSTDTGRCTSRIKAEPSELIVNKLRAYDGLYYADVIEKINGMKMYMENNLDAKSFYEPDPIIRKGFENEMINADNLPRVIFFLKEQNPEKFDFLKDVYFQLFPDIEDIVVKSFRIDASDEDNLPEDMPFIFTNVIYNLFVKDKNLAKPVNFSMMSDGAKRVFMILAKVIVSSVSGISLIAIEEPENSVHPGLFHAYLQILGQLLDDCKIIITSHSPYIISYLNTSCIYVGLNRNAGIAEFFSFKKSGQKQLEKDAADLKMSIGDYLFSMLADTESNIGDYLECDDDE